MLLLPPVVLAALCGHAWGRKGKRKALNREYQLTQPVMRQMRTLLHVDPLSQPAEHRLQLTVVREAMDDYELGLRQL